MYVYIFRVPHGCVFFYGDYNFVTAFDWKKKQQGTSRPSVKCHHSIIIIIIIIIIIVTVIVIVIVIVLVIVIVRIVVAALS